VSVRFCWTSGSHSSGRWDVIPCSPVENLIKLDVQFSAVVFDVLM
jgi:hypothetical protein